MHSLTGGALRHGASMAWREESRRCTWWRRSIAAVTIAFGLATIAAGGRVLFGGAAARASAGAYVPFVLAFNFEAGFAYVAAGIGLALRARWVNWLSFVIAGATVLVFVGLGAHAAMGGEYERRTVAAMTLRSAFWIAFAVTARRTLLRASRTGPRPVPPPAEQAGPSP